MQYSTNPVADAEANYSARFKADEAGNKAESLMQDAYLAACRKGDANALATFAPMVKDHEAARKLQLVGDATPLRYETLSEVLRDSLDFTTGPALAELHQLLLNVANNHDLVNQPAHARALLLRMSSKWAWFNSSEE